MLSMPKHSNCLFLAETTVREQTILDDAVKFAKAYGTNPLDHVNFKFMCYQTAHRLNLESIFGNKNSTIVILDEIHDSLSPVYFNFAKNNLLNTDIPRLGLTATVDKKTVYNINDKEIKKLDLLNSFCPIVYSYTVKQGQNDETSRKVNLFVLINKLDMVNKNIVTGTKTQKWFTTESIQYDYYDREFRKSLFLPHSNKSREFLIRAAASRKL